LKPFGQNSCERFGMLNLNAISRKKKSLKLTRPDE
jgi:hypothetical protein